MSGDRMELNCEQEQSDSSGIKFISFQEHIWHVLYDAAGRELQNLSYSVVADKGFSFSKLDNVFVTNTKRDIQVSVSIDARDLLPPQLVKVDHKMRAVEAFELTFYGIEADKPSSTIIINQSLGNMVPYVPFRLEITKRSETKVTVMRLRCSDEMMITRRKCGCSSLDQKYYQIVASLSAITLEKETIPIVTFTSEKFIVWSSIEAEESSSDSDFSFLDMTDNGSSESDLSIIDYDQ